MTPKRPLSHLPLLHNLTLGQGHVQGLVLAPTRELAVQVARTMYEYGRYRGVSILAVYGGQPYGRQISRLRKGVDVVVGTPGRLTRLFEVEPITNALIFARTRVSTGELANELVGRGYPAEVLNGDVVGTIAYHAGIPGSTIGAIHIQQEQTFVVQ